MEIRVTHHIDLLAADMADIPVTAVVDLAKCVRRNAIQGNRVAKANASRSAGSHGKHYASRFDAEAIGALSWEYGPSGHPQGEMSFEWGSRNQPPHLDLNRSADVQGPKFAEDVSSLIDGWFW